MSEPNIQFANIVASPTATSWSQAYNAGKLYAVLSLEKSLEGQEEIPKLASIGKEIISVLEQEYFTLEEKKLDTIKQAILQTVKKIPDDVSATLLVAAFLQNILYVFIHGNGRIILKRGDHTAVILQETTQVSSEKLLAASGFVKDKDTVILATESFLSHVTMEEITDSPVSEIAEALMPRIHELTIGTAAATLIRYQEKTNDPLLAISLEEEPPKEKEVQTKSLRENKIERTKLTLPSLSLQKISLPNINLTHKQKIFLTVFATLLFILAAGIYFTTTKQQESKTQALFESVYPQAKKKYEDGKALISLNRNLALEDIQQAKTLLDANKNKFPKGSKEKEQIDILSKEVDDAIGGAALGQSVTAKTISLSDSPLLSALAKHKDALYKTEDETNLYLGSDTEVLAIDKKTGKEKTQIDSSWKNLGGIGAFGSNIYVLDKDANQIYKFLGKSASSKSNYLLSQTDLTNATDMAIDGSIYVLFSNGGMKKFTRGKEDTFSLSGLSSPLSKPTHIFTGTDIDRIYILDKGNSRVVVLGKDGSFQTAYKADVIKSATDIAVDDKTKSLFVLSSGKLYKIEMK